MARKSRYSERQNSSQRVSLTCPAFWPSRKLALRGSCTSDPAHCRKVVTVLEPGDQRIWPYRGIDPAKCGSGEY